jgi:hypothetical protein
MPYRIQEMFAQLGGLGLAGAPVYTGATQITYKDKCDEVLPNGSYVDAKGLHFHTGVMWRVNGKPGQIWKLAVTLEPSDTYTVRLLRVHPMTEIVETGAAATVLMEFEDVYCDQVQKIAEYVYDQCIIKLNDGSIPLS